MNNKQAIDRNTVAGFAVTREELLLLTRLIGNHVLGTELDVLYEALCESCKANGIPYAEFDKPLPNAIPGTHHYGNRNMLALK